MQHARITEVRKPDTVGLHDQLGLHEPYSTDTNTFCYKCGAVIVNSNGSWLSTRDSEQVFLAVESTKRYNKNALDLMRRTPHGALYIGRYIRRTDAIRKQASRLPATALLYAIEIDGGPHPVTRAGAIKEPSNALEYAKHIDKKPRRDTWLAVLDYATERTRYLAHFRTSEQELLRMFEAERAAKKI